MKHTYYGIEHACVYQMPSQSLRNMFFRRMVADLIMRVMVTTESSNKLKHGTKHTCQERREGDPNENLTFF